MTAVSATTATGAICDLRTAWTFTDGDLPPDRVEVVGDRGSVELTVGAGVDVYAEGRRTRFPASREMILCGMSRITFWRACAIVRRRLRSLSSQALIGLKLADAAIESLRSS